MPEDHTETRLLYIPLTVSQFWKYFFADNAPNNYIRYWTETAKNFIDPVTKPWS